MDTVFAFSFQLGSSTSLKHEAYQENVQDEDNDLLETFFWSFMVL